MKIETHAKFPLFGGHIQIYVVPEKAPSLNIDMYMCFMKVATFEHRHVYEEPK